MDQLEKIQIQIEYLEKNGEALNKATQRLRKLKEETGLMTKRFQFGYLSTMFFGMQLQRTFGGIYNSGTKAFTGIMDSTEGASSALMTFNAGMEYLKFTVGDALNTALEPLLPTILGIIDGIANFIEQHPQLVSAIIIGAAAVGGLMFAFSELKLVIQGVQMIIGANGKTGLISLIASMNPVLLALAAAAIIVGVFISAEWEKIKVATEELGKAMKDELQDKSIEAQKHLELAADAIALAFEDAFLRIQEAIVMGMVVMNVFNKMIARWATSGILQKFGFSKEQSAEIAKGWFDISSELKQAVEIQKQFQQEYSTIDNQLNRIREASKFIENPQTMVPSYGQAPSNPFMSTYNTQNPQSILPANYTMPTTNVQNTFNITASSLDQKALADQIAQTIKDMNSQYSANIATMTNTIKAIP